MFKEKLMVALMVGVIFVSIFVGAVELEDHDDMIMEANIIGDSGGGGGATGEVVKIEVLDYLFLGDVAKGQKSEEFRVFMNNTGNVSVLITPQLTNSSEEVFEYLYFREQKTRGGENVPFEKIGDFSFNITKPTTGGLKSEDFYVMLDLRDYAEPLPSMMGHKVNVRFIAVKL